MGSAGEEPWLGSVEGATWKAEEGKSNAQNRNSDAMQSKSRGEETMRTVVVDGRAAMKSMGLRENLVGDQRTRVQRSVPMMSEQTPA